MSNVSNISNNSLCNSRSKNKNNSILGGEENSKDYASNLSFYLKDNLQTSTGRPAKV